MKWKMKQGIIKRIKLWDSEKPQWQSDSTKYASCCYRRSKIIGLIIEHVNKYRYNVETLIKYDIYRTWSGPRIVSTFKIRFAAIVEQNDFFEAFAGEKNKKSAKQIKTVQGEERIAPEGWKHIPTSSHTQKLAPSLSWRWCKTTRSPTSNWYHMVFIEINTVICIYYWAEENGNIWTFQGARRRIFQAEEGPIAQWRGLYCVISRYRPMCTRLLKSTSPVEDTPNYMRKVLMYRKMSSLLCQSSNLTSVGYLKCRETRMKET